VSAFQDFLGAGVTTPFQRDQKSDFANASGLANVKSCVGQILGTKAADPGHAEKGELEWRSDFGSLLWLALHRKGAVLEDLVRVRTVDALRRWEPRLVNVRTQTFFDRSRLLFVLRLRYDVITHNVAGNNVIFSDVEQDILLPVGLPQAA
jgi:phage baseplate assembly protein W